MAKNPILEGKMAQWHISKRNAPNIYKMADIRKEMFTLSCKSLGGLET
jgi:hypothetical protein